MSHHTNIVRIKGVYYALGALKDTVVFVGGATVSLYADRPEHADVRPTDDIDVLIEIATYGAYIALQQQLTTLGFHVDAEAKITCRYKYQGLTVDIMPTDEGVLGFSNRWYKDGFANVTSYNIDERTAVNIFSAAYFIATKLEAFKGRGNGNGRTSPDFEDIVFVLDNRAAIWEELQNTGPALKEYLKEEWNRLLSNSYIEEWISAHLDYKTAAARSEKILAHLREYISLP